MRLEKIKEEVNEEIEKKEIVDELILGYIEFMFKIREMNGRTQKLQIDFSELLGKMFGLLSVLRGYLEELDVEKLKNDLMRIEQELRGLEEKRFFIGFNGIKEIKNEKI